MGGTLVAQQPGYLPYLGFFDKVGQGDHLVIQDDLQYVKQEWQNRNRIQDGPSWRWLTVPTHSHHGLTVAEVESVGTSWVARHQRICAHAYRAAPYTDRLAEVWEIARAHADASLARLNTSLISHYLALLDIDIELHWEGRLALPACDDPNDRLIHLCKSLDCDTYLSGEGGHNYIDPSKWDQAGIDLRWQRFEPIEYARGSAPWIPRLSILDAHAHVDDLRTVLPIRDRSAT